jgi:hypothetical protein
LKVEEGTARDVFDREKNRQSKSQQALAWGVLYLIHGLFN